MPVGVTLEQMVTDLRAETQRSVDVAQGKMDRATLVQSLQRTQRVLYQSHDWTLLNRTWRIPLAAGQRYYDFPTGIDPEKLAEVSGRWNNNKVGVKRGIGFDEYDTFESEETAATATFTVTAGAAAASSGSFNVTGGSAGSANKVTSITVDGTELLSAAVLWLTSNTATAAALASGINAYSATSGYTAGSTGEGVTIYADPNLGSTADGETISVTVAGDVTASSPSALSGGASNFISSVKVDGLDITDGAVGWRTSNAATATAVAAKINTAVTFPEYTATAIGNRVTISALPSASSTSNGLTVVVAVSGAVTAGAPTAFAGGVAAERSDPIQAWDIRDTGTSSQIEVWPVPATAGCKLVGMGSRTLKPLIADTDVCTLDSTLIVLHAAVGLTKDAKRRDELQAAAVAQLNFLKGNQSRGTQGFNMASGGNTAPERRPRIDTAVMEVSS